MFKRLLAVLLALGLLFGGIFGWKYYQAEMMAIHSAMPPPPATVAASRVQTESWQPYLEAIGNLAAIQGIFVTNEVPGQVSEIHFESGQRVTEGDRLLQLDDSVDRAELEGRIAEHRLAEIRFQRMSKLIKERSVSQSEYDEAEANLDNAQASVASKQALIKKKAIRAPFSGLLGIRQVDVGEYLAPGSPIVPLQALDPIYVDYSLPERHLAALFVGQPIVIEVQPYPSERFHGRISALNPGIDPQTRSLRIRASLDNPKGRLRPGMFAEVRTLLPERQGVLTVPRTAITYNPYGDSVFVIQDKDGARVVQRRQVVTGEVSGDRVEILKGLKAGEQVVSAGQVKLRNGQTVTIENTVTLDPQIDRS
jgi:membrane fusion protein (multidrug efflux system)